MRRRHALSLMALSPLLVVSCRSFQAEAGFERPAELTATATAQAVPTPKPQLGWLSFIRGGDVWVKQLPDGAAKRLTNDGRNNEPRWSASGEWLAFRKSDQVKGDQVWLVRSDGSDAAPVDNGVIVTEFAWSPVEDLLAHTETGGTLRLAKPEIPRERELVSHQGVVFQGTGVNAFVWSPDGMWIAYEWVESPANVTQAVQEVKRQAQSGAGSPFVQEIRRIRVDGSESRVVQINRGSERDYLADWTPDGQWLLAWHGSNSGSVRAWGLPLEALPLTGSRQVQIASKMLTHQDFLSWSPDGKRLALVDGDRSETWENKSIAIATLAAGIHQISGSSRADLFPRWSPDGHWIAFTSAPAEPGVGGNGPVKQAMAQRKIWLMRPGGAGKRQLTNDATFRDERPEWSANGDYILFARLHEDQAQLWLMRADGSELRQVVEELTPSPGIMGYFGYIDWSQLYDWWIASPQPTAPDGSTPTPTARATPAPATTVTTQSATGNSFIAYHDVARV